MFFSQKKESHNTHHQKPVEPTPLPQTTVSKPAQEQAKAPVQPPVVAQPVADSKPAEPQAPKTANNPYARFQRPASQKEPEPAVEKKPKESSPKAVVSEPEMEPHEEVLENGDKIFRAHSIRDVSFADLWYTPEHIAYIRDKSTRFSLIPFVTDDMKEFFNVLDQGYSGNSSYAVKYRDEAYRVERIKTTTASALMKEFLETHGGFLYTIEDPPEMPLDGVYHAKNGALGLCKQTPVENERWEDGLKSALRSKPRYILVGEIRTPETASQTLRAATSGHLVLSTIHANSVEDALNSILKYAASTGLDDRLVADLLARGILAVVHQQLEGTTVLKPVLHTIFANPDPLSADQMRMMIRDGKISLGTLLEAQDTKLRQGIPLFRKL